ncbi:tRNA (adenosine(37)-N6)-threonylcarbamoyltransferase complex ATPase subunit type 1 TsaE [Oceanobacillus polygoni]|uniref:tRNA threonylcarbamoyladenosine biosynthesis protein TsaE n=1 Tax=Oceanobacillus polygoni TaxID=1235259 RepID=A0A9X1CJS5_9BACI|nr:tRNA (adenosine(37)-N6)-threonylcarbamoyltransferase complex ATPase subunit type 1 TsaE [Oceanobacillus polygoni]MBP2079990.1 tRNA threonylcarbamoyladenosine biosynthesis protein TsaE [Oceanobacillus polygoni]
MVQIQTNTVEETQLIAEKLATMLKPGDVITLEGELGAGKTTFTKGLAKGLGIKRNISSPTFTIIKEYEGRLPLYHMDVYRLEHSDEDIGFDEYFHGNGVTVVEWAHFIEEFLPNERLAIRIGYMDGDKRILEFTASGAYFEQIMNELIS